MTKVLASAVAARTPLFLANWQANEDSTHSAFVLKNGTSRVNLQTSLTGLRTEIDDIIALDQNHLVMSAHRDALRAQLHHESGLWRKGATYALSGTPTSRDLPLMPDSADSLADFLKAVTEIAKRWQVLDGETDVPDFTPPFILRDSTTCEMFALKVAALAKLSDDLVLLEEQTLVARKKRDAHAEAIYATNKLYREAVLAAFDASSPIVQSLPTLNASSTGQTPAPVALTVEYNAQRGAWVASWTPSTDPNLARYVWRMSAGPRFKSDASTPIATLMPGTTQADLPPAYVQPGVELSSKIYVETTTGHESGSNGVTITVPL